MADTVDRSFFFHICRRGLQRRESVSAVAVDGALNTIARSPNTSLLFPLFLVICLFKILSSIFNLYRFH